jgi:DNA-directed RNA polymerase specialized sigma24 family protein
LLNALYGWVAAGSVARGTGHASGRGMTHPEIQVPCPAPVGSCATVLPEDLRARETHWMVRFRETREEGAFSALYDLARAPLLDWIVHFLASRRQRLDPLEVLQDTFVNVYRYAASFDETGGRAFQGWARTIAANVVRRRTTRGRALSLQALPKGAQEPVDTRSGPDRIADLDEQRHAMGRAWTLLLLHYAEA